MKTRDRDIYQEGASAHIAPRKPVQCSLGASIAASLLVAVAPMFAAFFLFVVTDTYPQIITAVALVGFLTLLMVVGGASMWDRNPDSLIFSFGDLMLWNWVQRHRAERRLVRNTQLLGFDRLGAYQGDAIAQDEADRLELLAEIADALDAKSSYTVSHTDRVEALANDMGEALGLDEEELQKLSTAAFLHDVGNIRIPEHILRKHDELTESDRGTVESHALLGAMMAYEVVTREVANGILHHHERWDGAGYPNGLAGEEIPLFARIIAVAESFDAITSTRAHRHSLSPAAALEVLKTEAGKQFDPRVIDALEVVIPRPLEIFDRISFLAALRPRLRELALLFRRVGRVAVTSALTTSAIAFILGNPGAAS